MLHILWAYKCIKHAYISVFCWSFYSVHLLTLTKHLSSNFPNISPRISHTFITDSVRFVFNNGKQHQKTHQQHGGNNKISIT